MNISTHALCHTLVLRPMTDVRTKCFDNATLRRLQFEREIILRRFYGGRSMFAILGHSSLTELYTERWADKGNAIVKCREVQSKLNEGLRPSLEG